MGYVDTLNNISKALKKPVLNLLEANAEWSDGGDRGREEWREDIGRFAPGYLEMEDAGNGLATDYDYFRFSCGSVI